MSKNLKRYISILLTAAMLCTSASVLPDNVFEHIGGITVSAETSDYTFDPTTGTITGYSGAGGDVVIPDSIDGVPVKAIGENAFTRCTSLTKITMPGTVTSVGEYAFFNCSSLESVNLPSTLTTIGNLAFQDCSSLKEITIPAGVTSWGHQAFMGCTSLTRVTISEGVTSVGNLAFTYCNSLSSVTLPSTLTSIGEVAFGECTSLTEITIPKGVTAIEEQTFADCSSLRSVNLPDTLTSIGENAFGYCTSLTEITIPESVAVIDALAFTECTQLDNIIYPANTEVKAYEIPQDDLDRYLEVINNPNNPDDFRNQMQNELDKLRARKTIPETTTQVKYTVENGEVTITEIILPDGKDSVDIPETVNGVPVTSVNESVRDKVSESGHVHRYVDGTCTMCNKPEFDYRVINENEIRIDGYNGSNTEVVIPETIDGKTVTTIYELNGDSITKVTIPKSVKMIYGAAFNYNKPSSLAEICFDGFSDGFVTVGTSAFPDTVTKITFPEGLNDNDVRKKMTLTVFPANAELFSGTEPLPHDYVYVPDGSVHYQKCDACGHVKENSAETHAPEGEFITDNPNYDYEKYHHQKCKCGMVMSKFHEWDEGTEENDIMTYTCTVCGATKTETVEHNYVLTPDGTGERHCLKCTKCDKIKPDSYEAHAPEGEFITDNPNYDYEKYHYQKCKCGMVMSKFHEWDEGSITTQATCTMSGVMTYICTCGAVKTEEISKLPHSYENGSCTVCGEPDPDYSQPTDTEPPVTEPPVTDSSDTEPTVTQPPVTEPSDTEPTVTQPPVTEPSDTEPTVTQPPVTEPSGTEPTVTQPPVTEPSDTEPTVTQPPVTEPSGTEPTVTQPPVTEPIVTPAPSYPSYIPPLITAPSAGKEPYIYGDNGKMGWEAISDTILSTPDGGTVTVNMNGTTKLPKDIVFQIQGRDIDLVLDMGSGFTWTINGMSVTKAKTVDMQVRKVSKIPKSVVDEYFDGLVTIQIDLAHNGDFGFIAELTINLGNKYNGMYANSYCYKSRKFEFGDSSEIVNGAAKLRFAHASSWLITVESTPALEDVSSAAGVTADSDIIDFDKTVSYSFLSVILILGIGFVYFKKSRQK